MGSEPPPSRPRLPGSQSAAAGSGGRTLDKVWAAVSGRPRRTGHAVSRRSPSQNASQRFPGSCHRDRVPDFVRLELPRVASGRPPHVAALGAWRVAVSPEWRAPLTPARRPAGPSPLRGEGIPGPAREGSPRGSGVAGPRPFRGAGRQPVLSVDRSRRDYSLWPLEASPKPRTWFPWGTRPSSTWQGKRQLWSQTDLALVAV